MKNPNGKVTYFLEFHRSQKGNAQKSIVAIKKTELVTFTLPLHR